MTSAERVGRAKGLFKTIRLHHPGQADFDTAADELRLSALASPGEDMGGVQVMAPIGSGKTVGAELYAARINADAEDGVTPVVLATLDTSGTGKSIPSSILRALGELRPDRGDEALLWIRAKRALHEHGVQLLILDEMDRAARRPSLANHIGGSLRDLADARIVPLAFLCTPKSITLFRNCGDLDERLDPPVEIHPMDWLIEDDRVLMTSLVEGFDRGIAELGILPAPSGLADPVIVEALTIASGGILRRLKMIIGTAMMNVVRRGDAVIRLEDLSVAVDEYCIAKSFISENPFERLV